MDTNAVVNGNGHAKKMRPGAKKFVTQSSTSNYRAQVMNAWYDPAIRDGHMTWRNIPAMLQDSYIQIGLRVLCSRFGQFGTNDGHWQIKCDNYEVGEFVHKTLVTFCMNELQSVMKSLYVWGTVPGEAEYEIDKDGQPTYKCLKQFRWPDTQPYAKRGKTDFFFVNNGGGGSVVSLDGKARVSSPFMFWLANDPEPGNVFGKSRLAPAWLPWMERAGVGGAKASRKLWAFKYAFNGGCMRYPAEGTIELEDGTVKSNQDYAQEMLEKMENGAVIALPSDRDDGKNLLWEYIPASANATSPEIAELPDKLGVEIWLGMGIQPEVIQASQTGSGFSGRSVPFISFLNDGDADIKTVFAEFKSRILEPLVEQRFGDVPFEVVPDSLVPKDTDPQELEQSREERLRAQQEARAGAMGGGTGGVPQEIVGGGPENPVAMSHDVSDEPRDEDGKWTTGGAKKANKLHDKADGKSGKTSTKPKTLIKPGEMLAELKKILPGNPAVEAAEFNLSNDDDPEVDRQNGVTPGLTDAKHTSTAMLELTDEEFEAVKPHLESLGFYRPWPKDRPNLWAWKQNGNAQFERGGDGPIAMSMSQEDEGGGRWITIGARLDESGEKHGGSPVYIKDGKITKGHPKLTGKKIGALGEEADSGTHRQQLNASRDYSRATWAKRARKLGIDKESLHQLASEMKAHHDNHQADVKAMLKEARGAAYKMGVPIHPKQLKETGDHTSIPGFDTLSRTLATRYPHILGDHGFVEGGAYDSNAEQASEKLLDLLKHGNPEPMSEEDAYAQAFDYLSEQAVPEREPGWEDEPVTKRQKAPTVALDTDPIPFSQWTDEDEKKHPRGEGGKWVEAINAIPHGELKHVGGLPVRRKGEKEFRVETDTGHVTGEAEHVAGHIEEDHGKRKLHGKKREKALERASQKDDTPKSDGHVGFQGEFEYFKNAGGELMRAKKDEAIMPDGRRTGRWEAPKHLADQRLQMLGIGSDEPDPLTDPAAHKAHADAFAALPKGTKVVSLHPNTHGRVGEIVKDEEGRNRVKLEGTPGYASEHVEPLEEGDSWRVERKADTAKKVSLFDELEKQLEDGEITYREFKDATNKLHDRAKESDYIDSEVEKAWTNNNINVSESFRQRVMPRVEAAYKKHVGKLKIDKQWLREWLDDGLTPEQVWNELQKEPHYINELFSNSDSLQHQLTYTVAEGSLAKLDPNSETNEDFEDAIGEWFHHKLRGLVAGRKDEIMSILNVKKKKSKAKDEPAPTPEDTTDFFRPRHGNQPMLFSQDASGHEHKEAGPGGGQFTTKGGASQGRLFDAAEPAKEAKESPKAAKPKLGERSSKVIAAYAAAKQARLDVFNEVKADAEDADASADKSWDALLKLSNDIDNQDDETAFGEAWVELDTIVCQYDANWSVSDRFEHFKEIESHAKHLLEGANTDDGYEVTPEDMKKLKGIIKHARTARQHLKAYVQHRKEMQAIKEGSPMDIQLSMVYGDEAGVKPGYLMTQEEYLACGNPVSMSTDDAQGKWITIGGHEEGDKKHAGGFAVQIDADGKILKGGPKELRGKKVGDVKAHFDQAKSDKKSSENPSTTVDKDADKSTIVDTAAKETAGEKSGEKKMHAKLFDQTIAQMKSKYTEDEPIVELGGQSAFLEAARIAEKAGVPLSDRRKMRDIANEVVWSSAFPNESELASMDSKKKQAWNDLVKNPSYGRLQGTAEFTWGKDGYQLRLNSAVSEELKKTAATAVRGDE